MERRKIGATFASIMQGRSQKRPSDATASAAPRHRCKSAPASALRRSFAAGESVGPIGSAYIDYVPDFTFRQGRSQLIISIFLYLKNTAYYVCSRACCVAGRNGCLYIKVIYRQRMYGTPSSLSLSQSYLDSLHTKHEPLQLIV